MDVVTYALLKKYVKASLEGAGALKGDPGMSAYEVAVASGYSGTEAEWLSSLKGEAGKTPHIGDNGNWFIGDTDTNISATPSLDYRKLTNKPTLNGTELNGDVSIEALSVQDVDNLFN